MPVRYNVHGGSCCGIKVLSHFMDDPATNSLYAIKGFTHDYEKTCFDGTLACHKNLRNADQRVLEVVLIEQQMKKYRLKMLKEADFRLVSRFRNGNTGRWCYIFHRYIDTDDMKLFDGPGKYEISPAHKVWDKI